MLNLSRNKKLALSVTVIIIALLTVFGFFNVFAAGSPATDSFVMEQGAYVRIGKADGKNGIQFSATISKDEYDALKSDTSYSEVSFGMLVTFNAYAEKKALNYENVFGENAVYAVRGEDGTVPSGKAWISNMTAYSLEEQDGLMYLRGSIVGIKDANIARQYKGLAYIKLVSTSGDVSYIFAKENDNVRSVAYVAQRAIASGQYESYNEWMQTNYVDKVTDVDTSYVVNHYIPSGNSDGSYILNATESMTGKIASESTYTAKTYDIYTVNADKSETEELLADGKSVINVYYDVNEYALKSSSNLYAYVGGDAKDMKCEVTDDADGYTSSFEITTTGSSGNANYGAHGEMVLNVDMTDDEKAALKAAGYNYLMFTMKQTAGNNISFYTTADGSRAYDDGQIKTGTFDFVMSFLSGAERVFYFPIDSTSITLRIDRSLGLNGQTEYAYMLKDVVPCTDVEFLAGLRLDSNASLHQATVNSVTYNTTYKDKDVDTLYNLTTWDGGYSANNTVSMYYAPNCSATILNALVDAGYTGVTFDYYTAVNYNNWGTAFSNPYNGHYYQQWGTRTLTIDELITGCNGGKITIVTWGAIQGSAYISTFNYAVTNVQAVNSAEWTVNVEKNVFCVDETVTMPTVSLTYDGVAVDLSMTATLNETDVTETLKTNGKLTETGTLVLTYSYTADDVTYSKSVTLTVKEHSYIRELADMTYRKSPATFLSPALYYKSCTCGAYESGDDAATFEYGSAMSGYGFTSGSNIYAWADGGESQGLKTAVTGDTDGYTSSFTMTTVDSLNGLNGTLTLKVDMTDDEKASLKESGYSYLMFTMKQISGNNMTFYTTADGSRAYDDALSKTGALDFVMSFLDGGERVFYFPIDSTTVKLKIDRALGLSASTTYEYMLKDVVPVTEAQFVSGLRIDNAAGADTNRLNSFSATYNAEYASVYAQTMYAYDIKDNGYSMCNQLRLYIMPNCSASMLSALQEVGYTDITFDYYMNMSITNGDYQSVTSNLGVYSKQWTTVTIAIDDLITMINNRTYWTAIPDSTTLVTGSYTAKDTYAIANVQAIYDEELAATIANSIVYDGKNKGYSILIPESASDDVTEAASELQTLFAEATGVTLDIVTEYDSSAKYISIGDTALLTANSLTASASELGTDGYKITTVGKSICIYSADDVGCIYGVYGYLNSELGYDFLAEGIYTLTQATTVPLTAYDKTVVPSFDIRVSPSGEIYDDETLQKYQFTGIYADTFAYNETGCWHNSLGVLDPLTYQSAHSSWYYVKNDEVKQLCYTAGGDSDEYNTMIETAATFYYNELVACPGLIQIMHGVQDNEISCDCGEADYFGNSNTGCTAAIDTYGSASGALVNWLNDVAALVESKLLAAGDERVDTFKLVFFAYQDYEAVPSNITCGDHVVPMYAPVYMSLPLGLDNSSNATYVSTLEGWNDISSSGVALWWYDQYFLDSGYMVNHNTFYHMDDLYQWAAKNGVYWIYGQQQSTNLSTTVFGELKTYLQSKLSWDASLNAEDLIDKWFTGVYGDQADEMKALFDKMVALSESQIANGMDANNQGKHTYAGYTNYNLDAPSTNNDTTWWPSATLLELYNGYKTYASALTGSAQEMAEKEIISPLYWLLKIYGDDTSVVTDKQVMATELQKLCNKYYITKVQEWGTNSTLNAQLAALGVSYQADSTYYISESSSNNTYFYSTNGSWSGYYDSQTYNVYYNTYLNDELVVAMSTLDMGDWTNTKMWDANVYLNWGIDITADDIQTLKDAGYTHFAVTLYMDYEGTNRGNTADGGNATISANGTALTKGAWTTVNVSLDDYAKILKIAAPSGYSGCGITSWTFAIGSITATTVTE